MKVNVRRNNVNKASSVLSKMVAADGDLRRYIERSNGYLSKSEKKRREVSTSKSRTRKELAERLEEDSRE